MKFNTKETQQQYQGFLNTYFLWKNTFYGLQQIQFPASNITIFEGELTKNPRLGKRVESFVSCYLQQFKTIEVVHENIQIQKGKITIGELDFIITQNIKPIHLEVIFKYYLYDTSVGSTEIEHWIGPNRNDSLEQKIEKLSAKQLPLLFKEETQKYLDIDVSKIEQKVFFKAQLFVPVSLQTYMLNETELRKFTTTNLNKWKLISTYRNIYVVGDNTFFYNDNRIQNKKVFQEVLKHLAKTINLKTKEPIILT